MKFAKVTRGYNLAIGYLAIVAYIHVAAFRRYLKISYHAAV
jgi:hypothetical protein